MNHSSIYNFYLQYRSLYYKISCTLPLPDHNQVIKTQTEQKSRIKFIVQACPSVLKIHDSTFRIYLHESNAKAETKRKSFQPDQFVCSTQNGERRKVQKSEKHKRNNVSITAQEWQLCLIAIPFLVETRYFCNS